MTADGPEIGEPHLLEEGILKHEPLDPVLEALYVFGHAATHHAPFQHPDHEPLQAVVSAAGPEAGQAPAHGAHVPGDGHLVVVQDDDHPGAGLSGVVERLIAHAAGQRAVAHQGHDVVIPAHDVPGPGHAKGGGDRRGGVPRREGVVFALLHLGKAAGPSLLAEPLEGLVAPGQQLVGVGLMAHVQHQLVLRGVEDIVYGQRQLHDPQVGGQMAAAVRDHLHDLGAQLVGQLSQLPVVQLLQVRRFVYLLE